MPCWWESCGASRGRVAAPEKRLELYDKGSDCKMPIARIAVIDGQGGGMGKALVEKLRQAFGKKAHIFALGTNSLATSSMLKAGADAGATGENAIAVNAHKVDVIMGALGIVSANSMLGEITERMACEIGKSDAQKILLPINKCSLTVVGQKKLQFAECIEEAVAEALAFCKFGHEM